ncbi:hypothetical protein [Sandaracinus amylolyticus]|uniref:hypothetical protein n=1 Tax=Sandaracinus amylolyticus TaxID=927083 RepID=UPI001F293957|nr:hypothetical protein [Sandaracinus amylolyticus]UJR86869.1 Hypothetical protein I5071_89700 [Sandaracinus amylolyticus]
MNVSHTMLVPALALALLAAPSSAHACRLVTTPPPPPADHIELHWGIAFGVGSAVELTLIGTQIAMGDQMFPDWAAALELSLGTAQSVAGIVLMLAPVPPGSESCDPDESTGDERMLAAAFLAGIGGWLIAHAFWSFGDGPLDESPTVMPSVAFDRDAVVLHVLGTF